MGRVQYIPLQIGLRTYSPRNPFAAAQLRGLGAYRGLGDDNADAQVLFNNGFDAQQVQYIIQKHDSGALSDPGYQAILAGQVSPDGLDLFIDNDPGAPQGTPSTSAITSSPAPTATVSQSSAAAGVPTGTILTYNATWETDNPITGSSDPQSILRNVLAQLSGYGLAVVGQNLNVGAWGTLKAAAFVATQFGVSITVQVTNAGFSKAADIQSIIDHALYSYTGLMPVSSNISVGGSAAGTAPPGSQSFTAWLESNALWIFLGLGAFVLIDRKL